MNDDPIFDALMTEAAGNDAPDVSLSVLREAKAEGLLEGKVPQPAPSPVHVAPRDMNESGFRFIAWLGWAAAACAVIAIAWLMWPGDETPSGDAVLQLPVTVAVSEGGDYELREDAVVLNDGMAFAREGAPSIRIGDARVEDIRGAILLKQGGEPTQKELIEFETQLRRGGSLKPEELEMFKNRKWIVSGGAAVCVLVGSVMFNGDNVQAQDRVKESDVKKTDKVQSDRKTPKEQAQALMKKWDKNGDGVVTEDESNKPFMGIDANRDGEVSLEEMEFFYKNQQANGDGAGGMKVKRIVPVKKDGATDKADTAARAKKKVDDLFGKADSNRDGNLSKEEAGEALGEEADGWMKKLDADGDGKVTREEAEDYFGKETAKEDSAQGSNAKSSGGIRVGGGVMRKASDKRQTDKPKEGASESDAGGTDKQESDARNSDKKNTD